MKSVIPYDLLPPGFAERVDDPPDPPAPARPAATVVLLREGDGVEVLLVRRSRSSGFVPDAWVFPGGRVDPEDADPALLSRIEGIEAARATRRLGLDAGSGNAIEALAFYAAALREAFEETGILLARGRGGEVARNPLQDPRLHEARHAILQGRTSFGELIEGMDLRLDGSTIEYIAHWITPVAEPRRYDTRFFAAAVPEDAEVSADGREVVDARWLAVPEALELHGRGELPMIFPTIVTLRALAPFESPGEVLAYFATREIPRVLPRLVRLEDGLAIEVE